MNVRIAIPYLATAAVLIAVADYIAGERSSLLNGYEIIRRTFVAPLGIDAPVRSERFVIRQETLGAAALPCAWFLYIAWTAAIARFLYVLKKKLRPGASSLEGAGAHADAANKGEIIVKEKIIEAFHFRHACKVFDSKRKIQDEDFEFILETARLSPSSFGLEPWKFLVVQNQELREKLLVHTWGGRNQIPTASHFLVALSKKSFFMRYDSDYVLSIMRDIKHLDGEAIEKRRGFYETFQKSDHRLLDGERAMFDWACKQTYIAQANMMTAAAMIGIDSCPIEGFVADKVNAVVSEAFGVDLDKYGVTYMLAFGYRLNPAPQKTRQAMEAIVEWH